MSNVSKIQTRLKMIQAVCHLMDDGVAIGEISGVAVTDYCSVDKMYISRYFGDLAGLFMETVQYLLSEGARSMMSVDVFPIKESFFVDPNIEKAFRLATSLSGNEAYAERLSQLGQNVVAVRAKQLQETFGLSPSRAIKEAKLGIMLMAGYLSFGKALNLDRQSMQEFFDLRDENFVKRV